MSVTHQPPAQQDAPAVAVTADHEQAQRAAETHSAIILMACLCALIAGTQLLVALLGRFS